MDKNFWELTKEEMEKFLAEGAKEEIAKTHADGRPSTHGDDKGIYYLYPDGKKRYIKLYGDEK